MKVGIVGYGFVGKALRNGLKNNVKTRIIDPNLSTTLDDLNTFKPNLIFLCLPTPMNNEGNQDISILKNVIKEIKELNNLKKIQLIVKSTITPSNIKSLENIENLVINPEFLREAYAKDDFINAEFVLLGGRKSLCQNVKDFYEEHTKCKTSNFLLTDIVTALLAKYTINTFLASKVIFFNELFEVFQKSDSSESWEYFTKIISMDSRMGNSHMQVPGPDGRKGFGGACFPKDISAMRDYALSLDERLSLINQVIKKNNEIRSRYPNLTQRETDQSVSFKDK